MGYRQILAYIRGPHKTHCLCYANSTVMPSSPLPSSSLSPPPPPSFLTPKLSINPATCPPILPNPSQSLYTPHASLKHLVANPLHPTPIQLSHANILHKAIFRRRRGCMIL